MGIQITIRDVPVEVRDELAARAARARTSMQEYLRSELVRLASKPTIDQWLARVREQKAASNRELSVEAILAARDEDRR